MNHKRGRSKRQVHCTMCTKNSWRGNTAERHDHRTQRQRIFAKADMRQFFRGDE